MRGDSHGAAYMPETIGVMGIHEDVIVRFDSSAHFLKFNWDFMVFHPPVWDGTKRSPFYPSLPIDDSPASGRHSWGDRNRNQTLNSVTEIGLKSVVTF
jgi:hypothetical protein